MSSRLLKCGRISSQKNKWTFLSMLLLFLTQASLTWAMTLSTDDCRYCHGTDLSTRHHLLLGQTSYVCYDCHVISWDPLLSALVFNDSRDCLKCHTSSLADRHHLSALYADTKCLSCHAIKWEPATESFYVDFNYVLGRQQVTHYFYHTMTPNDCSGCHLTNIADEHEGKCSTCHESDIQTVRVAVTAKYRECTACHSGSQHAMKCAVCHAPVVKEKTSSLHRRHMYSVNCEYCHSLPDTYSLESSGQHCAICHAATKPYTISEIPQLHKRHVMGTKYSLYSCQSCHGKSSPQMHPAQCSVCHEDNRLYETSNLPMIHQVHSNRFDCLNCHFDPMDLSSYTTATSCERCHEARPYPSLLSLHGQSHMDKPCWACHPINELFANRQDPPQSCQPCHSVQPVYSSSRIVHLKHKGYQCWVCHAAIYPIVPTMRQPLGFNSGNVTGLIKNQAGLFLEGVRVFTEDGRFLTLSRIDGGYSLRNLLPGHYVLRVEKTGYESQIRRVKIINGQTTTIDFTLVPAPFSAASIGGRVMDPSNNAVAGATITSKALSTAQTTVTAPDGKFAIASVSPGNYVVIAAKNGYYSDRKTIDLASGYPGTMNFTLTPIPNSVLCTACHAELGIKVSCKNKKWKKHFKNGLVDKASYEESETTLLGKKCSETPLPALSEFQINQDPVPLPAGGDLSTCTQCHHDYSGKVSCTSKMWKIHLRKKRVTAVTAELAERTYLGGKCN